MTSVPGEEARNRPPPAAPGMVGAFHRVAAQHVNSCGGGPVPLA